tara:strand:+ start:252 stop:1109 length:858 start_codon:yes stop_codon:yes gene_type:complete
MTLLRSLKVLANDGATVKEVPVWANGTASGSYYELLKFNDGVDPNAGFVAFGPTSDPNAIGEIKVEHGVHGTLSPISSLVSWTTIEDFSNFPTDASVPPYDLIYGNPAANLVKILSPTPPGISQSAEQSSSTASTLASYNGGAAQYQFSPGEEFQMYFQMNSTSASFQTIFIYFSNTNAAGLSNYYRLYIDFIADKCEIQKNGSMIATASGFSSRPLGTWLICSIDYRKTSGTTITADIVDSTTSLSILNNPLSTTDMSYAGTGFAYYVKGTPGSAIVLSDLKKS